MDFAEHAGNDLPAGAPRQSNPTEPSVKEDSFIKPTCETIRRKTRTSQSVQFWLLSVQAERKDGRAHIRVVCCVWVCLTWCMNTRQQGEKQEKRSGSQPAGRPGGGDGGRKGQGCRLKRYHPIAHLFLRWPVTVFNGLTCAGHIERMQAGRERGRITINSTGYVTESNTRRHESTEQDWAMEGEERVERENCRLWIITNAWMNQWMRDCMYILHVSIRFPQHWRANWQGVFSNLE